MYKLKNRIISGQFNVIKRYRFKVINGHDAQSDPLILDHRNTSGDDNRVVQYGRSMIEMLGVLAIIGVLSVGGIAGYSKAMEKWKINKMSEEYASVFQGLIEYLDSLKYLNSSSDALGAVDVVQALEITPTSWVKKDSLRLYDSNDNQIAIFSRSNTLGFSVNIGGYRKNDEGINVSEGFSKQTCVALFSNVFYPLHSAVKYVYIFTEPNYEYFYGDNFCSTDQQCLRDVTLTKMNEACAACNGQTFCDISIVF